MSKILFFPWARRLTAFTALMTLVLLCAGALVTSTGSGLAVPDWPLSYGQFFPPMIGGILFEHGHRLIAGSVALLAIIQAIVLSRVEERIAVKRLSYLAVFIVLLQAGLGGLTVLFRLPPMVSVTHACLAQIFFTIVVVIALVTSKFWLVYEPKITFSSDLLLQNISLILPVLFFVQLLFGATMRHTGAGLAIPDFPLSFGQIYPADFTPPILIHFLHRMGALTVSLFSLILVLRIYSKHLTELPLVIVSGILMALISLQVMMGAMIIWLKKPVALTTAHLAVGACCLATSVVLGLIARTTAQTVNTPTESYSGQVV